MQIALYQAIQDKYGNVIVETIHLLLSSPSRESLSSRKTFVI